jgi:Glucodextranase, domain B
MPLTRTKTIRVLKIVGIILFVGCIVAYAIWRSLNYTRGPRIDVFEPLNGSSIASSTVTIRGRALRVNSLSLNGQTLSVDEQGNFNQVVIIFPGINKLTFAAEDQFGRNTSTELDIVGTVELLGQIVK